MSLLLEWSFPRCPLKKCIFCRVDIFVHLGPDTFKYSQDHIAKKKAPVKSLHFGMSGVVKAILCSSFIIDPVKASCCFSGLSCFLYPLSCCCRSREDFPSSSSLGSGRFAKRKVCATQSMVALHDSALMQLVLLLLNRPSLSACSKAPMILMRWCLEKLSRNGSSMMAIDLMYCWNLFQARVCLEFVPDSAAPFAVDSAAERSARKIFQLVADRFWNQMEPVQEQESTSNLWDHYHLDENV